MSVAFYLANLGKFHSPDVTFMKIISQMKNLPAMKRLLAFLLFMTVAVLSFAQQRGTAIQFRLSTGEPLTLIINDRQYGKVGKTLTVVDLPGKRHYVRLYRYRAYADGRGGRAELVFSGRIKVEPGRTYEAVLELPRRRLRMRAIDALPRSGTLQPPVYVNIDTLPQVEDLPVASVLSPALEALQRQMVAKESDADKLKVAKEFIKNNTLSAADLQHVASWVMFDENKLSLLQFAYPYVQDKAAYHKLSDVFTLEDSRQAFLKFIDAQR